MSAGRLIVFEGAEGSGKSTQARRLAAELGAVLTFEPGATAAGRRIRDLMLDAGAIAVEPRAEALLVAADRAQHVAEVIRPALEAGRSVVSDRYSPSTLAYQGHGRGLDLDELRMLSTWATEDLEPDLVVLLEVSAAVTAVRRAGLNPDRIEAAGDGFHERVMEGYRQLASADPERWVVVDGEGDVEEVAKRVRAAVGGRLGLSGWPGSPTRS